MMLVVAVRLFVTRQQRRPRPQRMPLVADRIVMRLADKVAAAVRVASEPVVRVVLQVIAMRLDDGAIVSTSDRESGFIRYEMSRHGIKMVNFLSLFWFIMNLNESSIYRHKEKGFKQRSFMGV